MSNNNHVYYLVPENNAPEIQLFPNEIYLIGRSPESNILLTDGAVSREHAKLLFKENTFLLEDLKSTNGTKVNEKLITQISLENLDKLTFGRIIYTFKIKENSKDVKRTLTPDDTKIIDKDLQNIISSLENSPLKNQLLSFQDKLDKKKKNLLGLAYRDDLTGLFNRRYFDKMLDIEIKRALRYKRILTLIMVDIDHFKIFNDTYGHQKGDSVLRTVGTILKENSRASDIVCRYGGEEIAILLPEQDVTQGIGTAEKLRKKLFLEAKEIEDVEITASFGVSSTGSLINTGELLIQNSDKALYEAKKFGRNCTKALKSE
ncbi:MAG: GGDEF domain-containing protein [Spirochaetaceae bacterium]|jgi:diguanylate cyclase (GGDEF)-like protein|nr:GGDEF domain-containing protein [Spirochaetaceae bacterium]